MDVIQSKFSIFIFVIASFISSNVIADCPDELTILPHNPTSSDTIYVTYCTNDGPERVEHQISGNSVNIWLATYPLDFIALPYENLTESISALLPGEYTFNVIYGRDGELNYSQDVSVAAFHPIPTISPIGIAILSTLFLVLILNRIIKV